MSFFSKTEAGILVNRFSQDLRLTDFQLPGSVINVFFQLGTCVVVGSVAITAVGYFAAAQEDYICTPGIAESVWTLPEFKDHRITKKSYAADHWIILSHAEQMCADLEEWLGQITAV